MELTRKQRHPLKKKDVKRLEFLQSEFPGALKEEEKDELAILTERRNTFGETK